MSDAVRPRWGAHKRMIDFPAVHAISFLAQALEYVTCAVEAYDEVPDDLQEALDVAAGALADAHSAFTTALGIERMAGG